MSFIQYLDVITSSNAADRPPNYLPELTGQNPDINAGYGGQYVWLVPVYIDVTQTDAAASAFAIITRGDPAPYMSDLAAGAGGNYIFQAPVPNLSQSITQVMLLRANGTQNNPPSGWDGMSTNINDGRMINLPVGGVQFKASYLYLIWKVAH